ncbi:MAG: hypothetical protein R3C14_08770 [Caldilineaceae bacterium]
MTEKRILLLLNKNLAEEVRNMVHDLSDTEILFVAPAIDERCIRDVAIHVHRPVLAATAVVTGRAWPPRPSWPTDGAELQVLLKEMAEQISDWLRNADEAMLSQPVTLRWGDFATGSGAILNSLVHGFVHVGAIRGIRAIGDFPLSPEA